MNIEAEIKRRIAITVINSGAINQQVIAQVKLDGDVCTAILQWRVCVSILPLRVFRSKKME